MIAIILFAIGAIGGVVLAIMRFQNKALPMGLALVHGGLGAAGLVALLVAVFGSGLHAKLPLALFVVAAIGGFMLFSFQLRHKVIPVGLMLLHAIIAAAALVLLVARVHGGG